MFLTTLLYNQFVLKEFVYLTILVVIFFRIFCFIKSIGCKLYYFILSLLNTFYPNSIPVNVTPVLQTFTSVVLSIYRDNNDNINGIICTPIFDHNKLQELSDIVSFFHSSVSFVCISGERRKYTKEFVQYIKLHADITVNDFTVYVYDTKGLDSVFLFDLSYFNSNFLKIKDIPIGIENGERSSMVCHYEKLRLIKFINANNKIEYSSELLFNSCGIDFDISFEELIEHIKYNLLHNKEMYLFYYHIVIVIYISKNIAKWR